MKVIIAGCRDFSDYECVRAHIDPSKISEIVSGAAKGVDALGERFAFENAIPVKQFPADWNKHGKSAGPIRNRQMAQYADRLIAFWDGKSRGTKNMIETMKEYDKPVTVHMISVNTGAKT